MGLRQRVQQAFGVFEQEAIRARAHFNSQITGRPYQGLPFLFESILDRAAPGAGAQLICGQDHGEDGGRPIPRNLVCSADIGKGIDTASTPSPLYTLSYTGGSGWVNINDGVSSPMDVDWIDAGYVSPGIDSSVDAISGNPCYLAARVIVQVQTLSSIVEWSFRWVNVTDGAVDILGASSVQSDTEGFAPSSPTAFYYVALTFSQIPCLEARYNRFMFQCSCPNDGSVRLVSYTITETRTESEPESSGTAIIRDLT